VEFALIPAFKRHKILRDLYICLTHSSVLNSEIVRAWLREEILMIVVEGRNMTEHSAVVLASKEMEREHKRRGN